MKHYFNWWIRFQIKYDNWYAKLTPNIRLVLLIINFVKLK